MSTDSKAAWRNRIIGLVLALVLYAVDQWLKDYMRFTLNLEQVRNINVLPFFDLTWVPNYGVSLGMLTATSMEMRWMLVALTGAIAGIVAIWMLRERRLIDVLALAMILGGALGNIHDRFTIGFVIDFINIHFWGWTPFVFNLADAAITVGVVIILARALFMGEKPAASQGGTQAEESAENS